MPHFRTKRQCDDGDNINSIIKGTWRGYVWSPGTWLCYVTSMKVYGGVMLASMFVGMGAWYAMTTVELS